MFKYHLMRLMVGLGICWCNGSQTFTAILQFAVTTMLTSDSCYLLHEHLRIRCSTV